MKHLYTLVVLTLLWSFGALFAAEVELFDSQGIQVSNYKTLLSELKKDDVLVFDDSKIKFRFEITLGEGNTTKILKVYRVGDIKNEAIALRVPLDIGLFSKTEHTYTEYIKEFGQGVRSLENSGIRIPKVYHSYKDQFVALELIRPEFDLHSYLTDSDFNRLIENLPAHTLQEAEEALYKFARTTSSYKTIGDFHSKQLVYDANKKEWVLLDFTSTHRKYYSILPAQQKANHAFSDVFYFGKSKMRRYPSKRGIKILERIEKEIYENRFMHKCIRKTLQTFVKPAQAVN